MKGNKQKGIYFILGSYDKTRHRGKGLHKLEKKSQIEGRANLLLQRNGYVWLKVVYGRGKDVWGKNSEIYNDGVYKTMTDLKFALEAFIEQSNIDYLTGGEN